MTDEPFKALRAGGWLEFAHEKDPKCPHCGVSIDVDKHEWWSIREEGEHDAECPSCDGPFVVSTYVQVTFSTDEQEGYE